MYCQAPASYEIVRFWFELDCCNSTLVMTDFPITGNADANLGVSTFISCFQWQYLPCSWQILYLSLYQWIKCVKDIGIVLFHYNERHYIYFEIYKSRLAIVYVKSHFFQFYGCHHHKLDFFCYCKIITFLGYLEALL